MWTPIVSRADPSSRPDISWAYVCSTNYKNKKNTFYIVPPVYLINFRQKLTDGAVIINIPYGQSSPKLPVIRLFGSFRSFGSFGSFRSFGSFGSFRSFR